MQYSVQRSLVIMGTFAFLTVSGCATSSRTQARPIPSSHTSTAAYSKDASSRPAEIPPYKADLPAGIYPVPNNICQLSQFYQVRTPTGEPLVAIPYSGGGQGSSGASEFIVPDGTVILEAGQGPRLPIFQMAGDYPGFTLGANVAESALIPLSFGTEFMGQMQVKTLNVEGTVNVWSQSRMTPNAGDIVNTVANGQTLTVLGITSPAPQRGNFSEIYVVTENGTEGYANLNYFVCP